MASDPANPALADIVDAIERIRTVTSEVSFEEFERDWQRRWVVERGVEIVSEASRRLSDEIKARHPDIPWAKVAGIGNVLRHEYERIAPAILWNLARNDLAPLGKACRDELHRESK